MCIGHDVVIVSLYITKYVITLYEIWVILSLLMWSSTAYDLNTTDD